jgi:hypothetical protein
MVTTRPVQVHPANLGQLHAWDGAEGDYWATHAPAFERSMAGYDRAFFEAAAITATDRVLDIGCGCGGTARAAARRATRGWVLAVDLSSAMLGEARRQAEEDGLRHVEFLQADVQIHPFERVRSTSPSAGPLPGSSRIDAPAWPTCVSRCVPMGGWSCSSGRHPSATSGSSSSPEPWLPDDGCRPRPPIRPRRSRWPTRQQPHPPVRGGLHRRHDSRRHRGHELRLDPDEAYDFTLGLLGWMLDGLDSAGQDRARHALRSTIESHAGTGGVTFGSAAWLVTATRDEGSAG